MFGSPNPFGQASSNPFGSQLVFGQTSNVSNNPFAPQQYGSSTPFGSQTGSSIFGGTATGMFGAAAQSSSPFSSATTFGASSSPAFGSSVPAFGASSSPAFGSSSSAFGGSSTFGQKPAFGGFGSSTQPNPFGSTGQPSQPAFGSSLFGSPTPFGAPSQPAFGSTSTPAFGSTSTPAFGSLSTSAFGSTSTPAFGSTSTPAFGSTSTPAFGSTSPPTFGSASAPAFGSTSTPSFGVGSTPAFGVASTPAFGVTSTPAFGSTASPAFGSAATTFGVSSMPFGSGGGFGTSSGSPFGLSTAPAFGTSSTPAFGVSSTTPSFGSSSSPAFGLSSTSSFNFSTSPAFGQSSPAFGSSPFGTATAAFGPQSSPFGLQTTTAPFGSAGFAQPGFGGQRGGSRVAPYTATTETENAGGPPGKFESISAVPAYKDKSHEELRWEDYQLGDKGGPAPPGQSSSFGAFSSQSSAFSASTPFSSTLTSPFSTSVSSNIFAPKPLTFGTSSNSAFGSTPSFLTSSSPFGSSSSSSTTSPFGVSIPFGTPSISSFASTPSLFSTLTPQVSTSLFNTGMSFGSSQMPPLGPTTSLGQSTASFGQSLFNTSSTGGSLFSTSSPLFSSASAGAFGQASSSSLFPQPSAAAPTSSFTSFGQNPALFPTGFTGSSASFGLVSSGQLPSTQSSLGVVPQIPVTNPFGILPQVPQMSIGRVGTAPAVQYGISSLPVVDKPAPVRISSLLTSRHLSQRRIRLPARKYHPKQDGPKVAFFSDEEEMPSTPKADALFVPRENPRALVIRPTDQWPVRAGDKISLIKNVSTAAHGNGEAPDIVNPSNLRSGASSKDQNGKEDVALNGGAHDAKDNQRSNGVHGDYSVQKDQSYKTLSGHRADKAAIVYEHGADIEALMPKLRRSDYYTEPRIQELAAKERAKPGFCFHVKDFVVGRHGYGCIKFLGETDVRRLDLEFLVQFNNREVIVYMDDSKKPPVGQGLNKPAEVTLLNIKCFDKKTGHQYTEGPKIEKYKEMLKRKAEDQGAEFVSYDPVKGEWKFRVHHFSKYKLEEEEEEKGEKNNVLLNVVDK